MWTEASWQKQRKTIKGRWWYEWRRDVFHIYLPKQKNACQWMAMSFTVHGEQPEFCGWKLIREKPLPYNHP